MSRKTQKFIQNQWQTGIAVLLCASLFVSSVVQAGTHFTLDGNVDYELAIDGGDDLTIKKTGGNGITIADDTGDVSIDTALSVGTTLTSTGDFDVNSNFTVTASSGNVLADGTIQTGVNGSDGALIIFSEGTTDYTYTIQPHATTLQNVVLTLPADDGTPDQVLKTDGSGALSWADPGGNYSGGDGIDITGSTISTDLDTANDVNLEYATGKLRVKNALKDSSDVTVLDLDNNRFHFDASNHLTLASGSATWTDSSGTLDIASDGIVSSTSLAKVYSNLNSYGLLVEDTSASINAPSGTDWVRVDNDGAEIYTNSVKRFDVTDSGVQIGTGSIVTTILDEDNMASDSATALATQQSIKAYVDSQVSGAGDDLGNHTATQALSMTTFDITGTTGDINYNNFDVLGASGNTTIGGTLTVSGASATVSDGTFSVTEDTATTNAVVDVASINATTSGTVANNFGIGITFDAEDLGGVEEQGSIDLVLADVTDTSEDTQFVFSVQEAGTITPELTVSGSGITLGTGATVDTIETSLTNTEDTHIPTSKAVADYVSANGDDLGNHTATTDLSMTTNAITGTTGNITYTNFSVVGATGNTTIGGTLTLDADGNITVNTDKFTVTATDGNTSVGGTLDVTGATTMSSTLDVTGNFNINTDKFQVIAGSGNTTIDGTLNAGASTLADITLTTGATVDDIETTLTNDAAHIPTSSAVYSHVDTLVGSGTLFELGGSVTGIQSKLGSSIADGDFSFAVGSTAEAAANYSWAIGRDVTANNTNSLAIGRDSQTNGNNAVAIGTGNNAESFGETVIGLYADDSATPNSTTTFNAADLLFVVGNGVSGTPSNAFEMYKSGDTTAHGDWTMNGWLNLGVVDPTTYSGMSEGSLAYDTFDNELQVYDGSTWQTIGTIGGGSDNLGNHTATQALDMDGNWIGGDSDGSEGVFVAADGDVGIGTSLPSQRLDVALESATTAAVVDIAALTTASSGTAAAGLGAGLVFNIENANDEREERASIDAIEEVATDAAEVGTLAFNVAQAGTVSEVMRVDGTDGYVGIGTTAPTQKLDITVDSATTSAVIDVAAITASSSGTVGNGIGAGLIFNVEDASDIEEQGAIDVILDDTTNGTEDATMTFSINQNGNITELMRLDGTDGYIGVGAQTAPDVLFDIYHETSNTNTVADLFEIELESSGTPAAGLGMGLTFNLEDAGDTEEQARMEVVLDEVTNGDEDATIAFEVNVQGDMTEVLRIDGTEGRVGIGETDPVEALEVKGNIHLHGSITYESDERLKENITPIPDALEKLSQLRGVTYDWIDQRTTDEQIGVIAQEVEQVFPQAVKTYADDTKVVNYPALIAPLIQAINELKVQNDLLQAEIEILKGE